MIQPFFDTNILVYAFGNEDKSERAKMIVRAGGYVSVQSLNEFTNVALKKLFFDWPEIDAAITAILVLTGEPTVLDAAVHHHGRKIAARYTLPVYDSMIIAAALATGCEVLLSEDMQHGMVIEDRLLIKNPFLSADA